MALGICLLVIGAMSGYMMRPVETTAVTVEEIVPPAARPIVSYESEIRRIAREAEYRAIEEGARRSVWEWEQEQRMQSLELGAERRDFESRSSLRW